jgi:hypothetical protein
MQPPPVRVTTHAEKIIAIDRELAVLMLPEPNEVMQAQMTDTFKRTNKHKAKRSPGLTQLEKWLPRAADEDKDAVRILLQKCARWVSLHNNRPDSLFSQDVLDRIVLLTLTLKSNSDDWVRNNPDTQSQ